MKAVEFCYWLQGFFELRNEAIKELRLDSGAKLMHAGQVETIERHLALVFKHDIDPKQGTPEHQAELQSIHDGTKPFSIGGVGPDGEIFRC